MNSAQRPGKIQVVTPSRLEVKKMSSEQIKNKVLNPEDRRKKLEDSLSKYSRERNKSNQKNNAYADAIKTTDNKVKPKTLYKNIMTFGNT
jgi:hypothetical protein